MIAKTKNSLFIYMLILALINITSCTILKAGSYASMVFMQESDTELAKASLPTLIKVSEALYLADTKGQKNAITTAQLYIMYANVFLETEAFLLPDEKYEEKINLTQRANALYLRAVNILLPILEAKSKGILLADTLAEKSFLKPFKKQDIPLLYWSSEIGRAHV